MARLRLSRYGLGHAVRAQCRAPSPPPEAPLSGPDLAGLRGWSEAARRPDTLAGRVRHRQLASAAADHARRSGPVFGCRDRIGVDAPACLPPCPAPGRGLRREHLSAARAGITPVGLSEHLPDEVIEVARRLETELAAAATPYELAMFHKLV